MPGFEDAVDLAVYAHKGQKDKAGKPYLQHLLRVALSLETEDEQIVGILHDILEDTSTTTFDLGMMGFPAHIIAAVEAMTHREGESYATYIARVGKNHLATRVKLADLHDNMQLNRLPEVTPKDAERYNKYKRAEQYLRSL